MKATALYDFTLTAGGTQVILADANFYKVLTATGDIAVTRDGGATVKPIRAGRGERNVPFQRLILKDLSGAPNSGTILVGDSDFIDDTIVISSAINVRPEVKSGSWSDASAVTANSAVTIFSPAANTGGAIVLSVSGMSTDAAGGVEVMLAKASAPSSISDGEMIAAAIQTTTGSATSLGFMPIKEQLIPAGLGLYYISSRALPAGWPRGARYKLL